MEKSFICAQCRNETAWHQKSRIIQQGNHLCLSCAGLKENNVVWLVIKNILVMAALIFIVILLGTLILFTTNSWAAFCLFMGFFFWIILSNRIGHRRKKATVPTAKS